MTQYAIRHTDGRFVLKSGYSHELELTPQSEAPRSDTYTALFADERVARSQRTRLINRFNKSSSRHNGYQLPIDPEIMDDWHVIEVKVVPA